MKEFSLQPFSQDSFTGLFSLDATAAFLKSTLILKWTLYGPTDKLLFAVQEDGEDLWKHTCFEFFLGLEKEQYLEWNFAPSGESNVYHFQSYRKPAKISAAPLKEAVKASNSSKTKNRLIHEVELNLELLPPSKALEKPLGAMTAVLESEEEETSHWAAQHPKEKPDFHLREFFKELY